MLRCSSHRTFEEQKANGLIPTPQISGHVLGYGLPRQLIVDTLGMGFLVWFIGYGAGFFIITIPGYPGIMLNPIVLISFSLLGILLTAAVAFLRFRKRQRVSWSYALAVGVGWLGVALVLDFLFIVLLFNAWSYYRPHIFVYYALTLLTPTVGSRYFSRTE